MKHKNELKFDLMYFKYSLWNLIFDYKLIAKSENELKDIYIQRIIKWAKNKPTSAMSCRKIARMINNVLQRKGETDSKGKIVSITYKTVSNILKKHYGRPKKILKVFYMPKKDKEKRYQFCNMILEKKINYDEILFTDESKISMGSYNHDYKRLEPLVN